MDGTVACGPNINAAAILLGSEGNVPVERTAMLMAVLLGAPVSADFAARAYERLAGRLEAAGFDEAMKAALRAEEALCADETLVNVISNASEDGAAAPGNVSVYWQSLATLARYCRVHCYLVSSRNLGVRPIDAIHAPRTGYPWLPAPVSA